MKGKGFLVAALFFLFTMANVFSANLGDVNSSGVVDIVDALMTAQYYVGLNPTGFTSSAADVNCDGSITIVDALMIAQYYVGLITTFPCSGATTIPRTATRTTTATATPISSAGTVSKLSVSGNYVKNASGANVVLKGVAIADIDAIYKGDRNQNVTTTVNSIVDIGCSSGWNVQVFRLTIHPTVNDETGNHGWLNYTPDTFFNNILNPAVQYIISKGKYVIVDWHYVGASWTDSNVVTNTVNFWNYIAPKYADHPNVIFELFNEPGQAGNWSSWKTAAQGWVNTIRNTHGADNLIIVGGPNWSQTMPASSGDLLTGGNIVYACHIYPQHGIPNWIDWVANNAPVIMTEWGYEYQAPNPVNGTSSWGNQYKSFIKGKPNVGWVAWCFDFVYRSVMFDKNWTLLGNGQSTSTTRFHGGPDDNGTNYMGQFAKTWLSE